MLTIKSNGYTNILWPAKEKKAVCVMEEFLCCRFLPFANGILPCSSPFQVDPEGPLATLRKILLSEESIASLQKFLTTHWYIVILLIAGVFALMVRSERSWKLAMIINRSSFSLQFVIVRFCGKKPPLVRRKRRHHHYHQTVQGQDPTASGSGGDSGGQTEVQVHPTAVEATVPFGKKVRKGENRKKKKSSGEKSKKRAGESSSRNKKREEDDDDDWRSTTQEAVSRATRLAANLSNLIVNLPPETRANNAASSPQTSSTTAPESPAAKTVSPKKAEASRSRRRRRSQDRGSPSKEQEQRHTKSLSPEKTIAAGVTRSKLLAESVTSISKSFEKLDLVGHRRKRKRREQDKKVRRAGSE